LPSNKLFDLTSAGKCLKKYKIKISDYFYTLSHFIALHRLQAIPGVKNKDKKDINSLVPSQV